MEHLTIEQVAKINKVPLAEKYNCTPAYVALVLKGERRSKTKKAKLILQTGHDIIKILEGEAIPSN
jgi:hypothetical protein